MEWICCQLGAREHYAIPRALFRQGSLDHLLTDAWAPTVSLIARLGSGQRLDISSRFHPELKEAPVTSFNWSLAAFEMFARARGLRGWPLIVARNHWFQTKIVGWLSTYQPSTDNEQPTLFTYSYAAQKILRCAKSHGWRAVLGQIDPGPIEEEIVAAESEREALLAPDWRRAPLDYWKSWREECEAADRIIVNSEWSRSCLLKAGVSDSKLSIIPLAYESPITDTVISRKYPSQFTSDRPLRVLFLGQIGLRKGIARLLKAARALASHPIEFSMVGPIQININEEVRSNRKIQWVGPIAWNKVRKYYEQADVFILPTLSDGFGLTQLEALAHRLPVIASRQCGEVITDHVNGLLLEEPTAAAIEEMLLICLHNPDRLAQLSENANVSERLSLSRLGNQLCALAM